LICFLLLATPASSFELTSHEPVKQFNDIVKAHGAVVAALHVTALGGETNLAELTWAVSALPCAGEHFAVGATEGQIAETQASSRELEIGIVSAHFSHGIHCHARLPSATNEGTATVTVKPVKSGNATTSPVSVYEDDETKVESFSSCVTLADTCAGKYVLRAYIAAPRIHVVLEYAFTVTPSHPFAPTVYGEPSAAIPSVTERLEQCPIPSI